MKTTTLKNLISDDNSFGIKGITIPRIQRSYAQGRSDAHAVKTRDRFLTAIHKGLTGKGMTLDFVYGNVQDGRLIPLDGQQRLTTLWLLHWYAAKREGIKDHRLERFSYNTRYSARDFIAKVVDFDPSFIKPLSEEIRNQGWFPMDWYNDPTVSGMLTMLDEIQVRFADIDTLWDKLDRIDFYFRDIDEMKLTDEIYIKMNSRGKPLTDFEHFKAELLKIIKTGNNDEAAAKRIGIKIDREWTDLLWVYRNNDHLVDDGFLNLFRMLSLILIYRANRSASEYDLTDDFGLLDRLYKGKPENVAFLEQAVDCLVNIQKTRKNVNPESNDPMEDFFESFLSKDEYQEGKVVAPQQISDINLLRAVLDGVPFRRNTPAAYWVVMVYTFLLFLTNEGRVEDSDFRRRLRVVVNLLKNSRNEVVDNPNGDAGNRMPANLLQVENIILYGEISDSIEIEGEQRPNFNALQMEEERHKLKFTQEHPESAIGLFQLEDHRLIEGRTEVVGYENTHLHERFIRLFDNCSRDEIDCAMLAIGDYSQRLNTWCVQLGSGDEDTMGNKAWHSLFHPSGKNPDFIKTKESLRTLLEMEISLDDEHLNDISEAYLTDCRNNNLFDWRYYYITYPSFRAYRFGKYTMQVYEQPYNMVALHTEHKESSNAYQCMLDALMEESAVAASSNRYGIRELTYRKGVLTCENDAFVSYTINDLKERARFVIPQNADGIDTVDRIEYFKDNRRNEDMWIYPEA